MRTDLFNALLRDRDDVKLWAVYADWLESTGDPRGALSSFMLKREVSPSRAMEDAFLALTPLLQSLTPESLKTLTTRGNPRLAPVFRRGFLFSAGATQASDFEALLRHPSAALLENVILESAELEAWFALVDAPLPWRRLELNPQDGSIDLSALTTRLPFLETLTLETRCDALTLPALPSLKRVRVRDPDVATLETVLDADLPSLKSLELLAERENPETPPELDDLIAALAPHLARLTRVVLEGTPGPETASLVRRAKQVRVRAPTRSEASFVVVRGDLSAEHRSALATFAKLGGVTRLTITEGLPRLGATPLRVLQFNGTGEVPLAPRSAVQHLARKDRALDAVAFTLSGSNNIASTWSVGPHLAPIAVEPGRVKMIPVSRRDEGTYREREMIQAVLGALAGLDPGLDVLDELLEALELGTTQVLLGAPLAQGEVLPLFTDYQATEQADDEAYDDEEDEEDEDEDLRGEDDEWDTADPWGATPVNVPDFGPREVTVAADEDDPEDDLDAPLHDAATADEAEVWTEGPIDLPEHHDSLPGDPIAEPELRAEEESLRPNGEDPCPRCHQPGELERCAQCLELVCCACAGGAAVTHAFDAQWAFACAQCESLSPGRFVTPR
jgi:uncharacterized protein (TIGR02996 family)